MGAGVASKRPSALVVGQLKGRTWTRGVLAGGESATRPRQAASLGPPAARSKVLDQRDGCGTLQLLATLMSARSPDSGLMKHGAASSPVLGLESSKSASLPRTMQYDLPARTLARPSSAQFASTQGFSLFARCHGETGRGSQRATPPTDISIAGVHDRLARAGQPIAARGMTPIVRREMHTSRAASSTIRISHS